ncbi:MAG: zf-HC2 domain-containing protein [Pyrinomonadaceae bacterium]
MTCDDCKVLIGVFMDNDLDEMRAENVRDHLAICSGCARICEDLASILDVCSSEPASELTPNSKALWCRINNIIESEVKANAAVRTESPAGRFWRLSTWQATAGVLFIAVLSSLLTFVAVQNYREPIAADFTTRTVASQTTFEKLLSRVGLADSPQQARERRLKEQRSAIEYWDSRVQARRVQWDRPTREAFDRNLQVIDEVVSEYTMILDRDPGDELSGEMLDTVLNEKMNLLRDFSDL